MVDEVPFDVAQFAEPARVGVNMAEQTEMKGEVHAHGPESPQ